MEIAPKISDEIEILNEIFASVDTIVGYNTDFDLDFIAKAGVKIPYKVKVVDVMALFAKAMGEWDSSRNDYKWYKLTECAEHYGYAWSGTAHDSLSDARATMFCFKAMTAEGIYAAASKERQ